MHGTAPNAIPPAPTVREPRTAGRRPWWIIALAVFSFLLFLVTEPPQFYYVLYELGLVPIGPHTNPLGEVWYWYSVHGDNNLLGYHAGNFGGALEDSFLLDPLYFATGIGLLVRRRWTVPVGLMGAAMLFYGTAQTFVPDALGGFSNVPNLFNYWLSLLPYIVYPLWLIPTLLVRGAYFNAGAAAQPSASRRAD
jgi:hypothetical protein